MNEYQFIQLARKNSRTSAVKIAKDQFFKISFLTAAGSYFLEIFENSILEEFSSNLAISIRILYRSF